MLYLGSRHASICKILYNKIKNMDTYGKMPWHSHLKPAFPNRLLTDAFLIISVINVSHRAMRLISHMQSWDHLEQGKSTGRKNRERERKQALKESVFPLCVMSAPYGIKPEHLHYSHFSCCVLQRYTVPSAVLWHVSAAISPLNSGLIIPIWREYSNKANNAFFHMILLSWDSCSAAFSVMFGKGHISAFS